MPQLDVTALRQAVKENRYLITRHAQQRMGLRKITHADLNYVVANGDVVEEYPDNQPNPKALFMAHLEDEPLYVSWVVPERCVEGKIRLRPLLTGAEA